MKKNGKLNLSQKKNFDENFWHWSVEEKNQRKIQYFYENFQNDSVALIDARNKIILLAEEKCKIQPMRQKEILKQTIRESDKADKTKSYLDISKAIICTDNSSEKLNKNSSCFIF